MAPSSCPRLVCYEGELGLTAAIMADDHCKPFTASEIGYGFQQGFWKMTPDGYLANAHPARGQYDAYGRIYHQGEPPRKEREFDQPDPAGSWTWNGWCPPKAAMQPAAPPSPPPPTCPAGQVLSPTGGPHGTPGCVPCGAERGSVLPCPGEPPPPPPTETGELCPTPTRVKLGWAGYGGNHLVRGIRNLWSFTPMVPSTGPGGSCEWKRNKDTGLLPAECEAHHSCAEVYGDPLAYQDGPGFRGHPVERASVSQYNLVIATNWPELWTTGRYGQAGEHKLCATLEGGPLKLRFPWRCQRGYIDEKGFAQAGPDGGFGKDGEKSFDENR